METQSDIDPRLAAWIKEHCGPHCYGEQDENGIDLSLIRENLKLSPLERARLADDMRRQAEALLEAGRRHREKSIREDR